MHRLEASEDKIVCDVDHWLNQIIEGFINEFAVDTLVIYSEVEKCFLKGLRGTYVKSLNTWTKMLFVGCGAYMFLLLIGLLLMPR